MNSEFVEDVTITSAVLSVCFMAIRHLKKKKKRRFFMRPDNINRHIFGFYATAAKVLKNNPEEFFKYTRMTIPIYESLMMLMKEQLERRVTTYTIPPDARMMITLS